MATYDTQQVSGLLQKLGASDVEPLAARDRLVKALEDGALPRTRTSPVDEAVWADDVICAYNDYFGCVQSMFSSDEMDAETSKLFEQYMEDLEDVAVAIDRSIIEPMGMLDALSLDVVAHGRDTFVFDAEAAAAATSAVYVENLLGTVGRDYKVYMGPVDPNTDEPLSASGFYSATELADAGISGADALTHLYDARTGKMAPAGLALKMVDAFAEASAARGGYVGAKESGQMPAALERELLGPTLKQLGEGVIGKVPSDEDTPAERAVQMRAVDRLAAATTMGPDNPYARHLPHIAARPTCVVECVAAGSVRDTQGRNIGALDAFGAAVEARSSYKGFASDLSETAVKKGCERLRAGIESVRNSRFAKFCANTMAKTVTAVRDFADDVSERVEDARISAAERAVERHERASATAAERLSAMQAAKEERLSRRRVPDVSAVETLDSASEYGA